MTWLVKLWFIISDPVALSLSQHMNLKDLVDLFQSEVNSSKHRESEKTNQIDNSKRRKRKKKVDDKDDDGTFQTNPKKKKKKMERNELVRDSPEENESVEVTSQKKTKKKSKKTDFVNDCDHVRLQCKTKEAAKNNENEFSQNSSSHQTQQKKLKRKRSPSDDNENDFFEKHSRNESDSDSDVVVVKDLHKSKRRKTKHKSGQHIFNDNSTSDQLHSKNTFPKVLDDVDDDDDVVVVVDHFQDDSQQNKSEKDFKENDANEVNKNSSLSQVKSKKPKGKKRNAFELKEIIPIQDQCNKNIASSSRIQSKGRESKKVKTNRPEENVSDQLYYNCTPDDHLQNTNKENNKTQKG